MSATKAVSGVPSSAKTEGTPQNEPILPFVTCFCHFLKFSFRVGDLAQLAACCIQPENGAISSCKNNSPNRFLARSDI